MRNKRCVAPSPCKAEANFEVCSRQMRCGLVRPLDQTNPDSVEILLKTCIKIFVRVVVAIKIKVI
jgi:hypothetical protein